jgi:hypothetical protein
LFFEAAASRMLMMSFAFQELSEFRFHFEDILRVDLMQINHFSKSIVGKLQLHFVVLREAQISLLG